MFETPLTPLNLTAVTFAIALILFGLLQMRDAIRDGTLQEKLTKLATHYATATRFFENHYLKVLVIIGVAGFIWGFWRYLSQIPSLLGQVLEQLGNNLDQPNPDAVRSYAYAFAAMAGAMALLFTIPFQFVRVWINERTTRATEQGLITDRINKAVEQLGAEKAVNGFRRESLATWPGGEQTGKVEFTTKLDWTENREKPEIDLKVSEGKWEPATATVPNLEVRIGAIYALERIAQDSERDHIQVMEILCAYIRENAPASIAEKEEQKAPRTDIQAALEVLGRRDQSRINGVEANPHRGDGRYRLDLRATCLQSADLSYLSFQHALFNNAHLEGAKLIEAHLERADLSEAHLEGANLYEVHLEGADLSRAHLERADLGSAHLEGANLSRVFLEGASLSRAYLERADLFGAYLDGASLSEAYMERADLIGAHITPSTTFKPASLRGAGLRVVDLSSQQVDLDILAAAFGDGSVKLPDSLTAGQPPLRHWQEKELNGFDFYYALREWQSKKGYD
ncbi:MAG: pentapeptide repeat-containing protein [Pseudomonadota bacterium]